MDHQTNRRSFLQATACAACAAGMGEAAWGETNEKPKPNPDSYCGLYCGSCTIYLKSVAQKGPAKAKCLGCKSDKLHEFCAKCEIKKCAEEKEVKACGEGKSFPCEKTKKKHGTGTDDAKYFNVVAEKNCYTVKEKGHAIWLKEQARRWKCPKCGASFSMTDQKCPKCAADVLSMKEEAAAIREARKKA